MGIYKERQLLEGEGYILTEKIPFEKFKEKWTEEINDQTHEAIIKDFWEDYMTCLYQTIDYYLKVTIQ